eukprot:scaffold4737_cov371-Prasinococcus_capsulatus_cf.AAC.10
MRRCCVCWSAHAAELCRTLLRDARVEKRAGSLAQRLCHVGHCFKCGHYATVPWYEQHVAATSGCTCTHADNAAQCCDGRHAGTPSAKPRAPTARSSAGARR